MFETVGYVIRNKKDFYKFLKKNKNTYYAETMYNVKASDWEFLFDKYKIDGNLNNFLRFTINPIVMIVHGHEVAVMDYDKAVQANIKLIKRGLL